MRKFYLRTAMIVSTLFTLQTQAQILSPNGSPKVVRCYTVEELQAARQVNANIQSDAAFESWMQTEIQQRKTFRVPVVNYNLPIIFHIIHSGQGVDTLPNLSQSSIKQQVLQLNKDFGNLSNSPYAAALSTGIQFQLATTDPSGNTLAEPGIERINSTTKPWTTPTTPNVWSSSYVTSTIKPATIWDPTKYINIFIVGGMTSGSTNLLGFSTFPGSSTLTGLDNAETNTTAGVAIIASSVGSIFSPVSCDGTNQYAMGRTLTHELGHFFGLRHIWGDATCGNDYCDDTPIHQTANYGVFTHPKTNTCGTPDEMFENYMDYSDDKMLNTFTADQVDRMQVVMLNSPRRVPLATSTVGKIPVTASNKISFSDCSGSITVSEAGTTGTYPRYRDISLFLNVEDKATGTATVTFIASGTAVNNVHYQLLNPAPSFAAGDRMKQITVRILDNASVDGDKTLTLNYSIAGTGVAAGTAAQSFTINIIDDDNVLIGQNLINLLNEGFEGAIPGWTATNSSVNAYTISANGDAGGSGKCAHISNTANSTKTNTYTTGIAGTAVLKSPVIDPSSVQSMGTLSFKYKVRGSINDNAYLTYLYSPTDGYYHNWGTTSGFSGYGPYYGTSTAIRSGTPSLAVPTEIQKRKFNIAFYWSTTTTAGGGSPGFNVDDVVLTATPYSIETIIADSYGYDVLNGTNNNLFRSTNSRIVASIINANTAANGVVASITEAGADKPSFTRNGTTYLRSRKLVKLAPATTGSSSTYTATFYFTSAEMTSWGASLSSAKLMKVNEGSTFASVLNSSNTVIVTPVITDKLSTDGYIAVTASFTGFGTFALIDTLSLLPVNMVEFTGAVETNKVHLKWSTASEHNNNGFEIQRSFDANNFVALGWVNGQNNITGSGYNFMDENIVKGNKYYYRLKQVDNDGKFTYSKIITVVYSGINASLTVFPNPVSDKLTIWNKGAAQNAVITVTDASGKVMYTSQGLLNNKTDIPSLQWSNGIYIVKVQVNEEVNTFKIIKN